MVIVGPPPQFAYIKHVYKLRERRVLGDALVSSLSRFVMRRAISGAKRIKKRRARHKIDSQAEMLHGSTPPSIKEVANQHEKGINMSLKEAYDEEC
jgi:hypothetical protein